MAKHKQPKNEKHKARKDLKDYTHDKDVKGMVPDASGEIMPDVPRKDDKEVIDDVENMVPKIKDSDRVYVTKQMEDGDPKRPANSLKTFEKQIEDDAKDLIDTLSKKDGGYMTQIEKLTKEQKEKLVREVVKRKVLTFLSEQEETDEEPLADTPEPAPAPEAPEIPADTAPEPEPEPTPEPTPASEPATEPEEDSAESSEGDQRVSKFIQALEQKPNIVQQMKTIMSVINTITADDDKKRRIGKLMLLKRAIDRAVASIN